MADRFEYYVLTLSQDVKGEDAMAQANALGAEGWELVSSDFPTGKFIFKRKSVTPG